MHLSFRPLLPGQILAAWAREIGLWVLIFPRVPVETPAPPVLGKGTLRGQACLRFLSSHLESKNRDRSFWLSLTNSGARFTISGFRLRTGVTTGVFIAGLVRMARLMRSCRLRITFA